MGKVARHLVGLVIVVGMGCSFEADGSSDSNQLGSSAGSSATESSGDNTQTGDSTEGDVEGSTSFVGGSTSVGNDEACVDTCVPAVPAGWAGPFYVADATTPVECPTGFARQDLGFQGLSALPPTCACNCDTVGGDCGINYRLSGSGCGLGFDGNVGVGACNDHITLLGVDAHMRPEPVGSPGSCVPNVTMNLAEATWESASTFCDAPARGGDCGQDQCIAASPDGYATKLCISGEGDVDCPTGDWDTRTVVYRSVKDDRGCTGCECSGPSECQTRALAYDNGTCNGAGMDVAFNQCNDISVSGTYSVGAAADNGSCVASTVTAAGEAVPTDPITLCCAS